jgi:hypothetical protein
MKWTGVLSRQRSSDYKRTDKQLSEKSVTICGTRGNKMGVYIEERKYAVSATRRKKMCVSLDVTMAREDSWATFKKAIELRTMPLD